MCVCLDSYINCNIKGRSVYFTTGTVRKNVELLLIVVFSDQRFENGFGVPNEPNKSHVMTNCSILYIASRHTSVQDTFKRLTLPDMGTEVTS